MRDVISRGMTSAQIARSPRALSHACLDIPNPSVISELRPLKDDVISRKSMDFDKFESIFQGSLLKSVHFSLWAGFFWDISNFLMTMIATAKMFGISLAIVSIGFLLRYRAENLISVLKIWKFMIFENFCYSIFMIFHWFLAHCLAVILWKWTLISSIFPRLHHLWKVTAPR